MKELQRRGEESNANFILTAKIVYTEDLYIFLFKKAMGFFLHFINSMKFPYFLAWVLGVLSSW